MSNPEHDDPRFRRPRTRGDCRRGIRPCPWVSCTQNLLIDVLEDGTLVLNAETSRLRARAMLTIKDRDEVADDAIEDAVEYWFDEPRPPRRSCAIDEAEAAGGMQLDEIADLVFVTRERVRQLEAVGLRELSKDPDIREMADKPGLIEIAENLVDRLEELAENAGRPVAEVLASMIEVWLDEEE